MKEITVSTMEFPDLRESVRNKRTHHPWWGLRARRRSFGFVNDASQQPRKHKGMKWRDAVPVDPTPQATWFKSRALRETSTIVSLGDTPLQPRVAGQEHFRVESHKR